MKGIKIFIAVLDWGLGHATRSSRLILELESCGHEVIIASAGEALIFLKTEFPGRSFYALPEYRATYSSSPNRLLKSILVSIPRFYRVIREEHRVTKKIVLGEKINLVIADNRYGCYSDLVPSVFIGHQLIIPFQNWIRNFNWLISALHHSLLKNFSQVWVPDTSERSFSGLMGMAPGLRPSYIGPLSRFTQRPLIPEKKYFITAIVSGPEPNRKIFAGRLREVLSELDKPCNLLLGLPSQENQSYRRGNLTIHHHLPTKQLQEVIENSEFIISRSGFSSVVDLSVMSSKVLFVPTPGQPEQEYLARYHSQYNSACWLAEHELTQESLQLILPKLRPLKINFDGIKLQEKLRNIRFVLSFSVL